MMTIRETIPIQDRVILRQKQFEKSLLFLNSKSLPRCTQFHNHVTDFNVADSNDSFWMSESELTLVYRVNLK